MMKETRASRKYTLTSGSKKKSTACKRNIVKKTHFRPIASDNQAHLLCQEAVATEMMLTRPAATVALTPAISCAIGAASTMIEMPAETFRNNSAQSAYHCQVLKAPPRS